MSDSDGRVQVKAADMPPERQQQVIEICLAAVDQYTKESDIAQYIKKTVEAIDSPTWHCIVGLSFGSCVAHSQDHFLHLEVQAPKLEAFQDFIPSHGPNNACYILLFKTL